MRQFSLVKRVNHSGAELHGCGVVTYMSDLVNIAMKSGQVYIAEYSV